MNERQAYALAHPINTPAASAAAAYRVMREYGAVRRHGSGLLLRSILAVDR